MNIMEITCKDCGNWYKLLYDDEDTIDQSCPVCKSINVKVEWICPYRSCDDVSVCEMQERV